LAVDTVRNKVYFAGGDEHPGDDGGTDAPENWVVVVDAVTLRRVAHVRVPMEIWGLSVNQTSGKLYCASPRLDSSQVYVIDCTTDSLVATIKVGSLADSVCVNPDDNKVYVACSREVTVIDAYADTVLAHLPVLDGPEHLTYANGNNTVYCGDGKGRVSLIDGRGDSIRSVLALGPQPGGVVGACWNTVEQAYYCLAYSSGAPRLFVIDGFSDSVTATMRIGQRTEGICWNPADNRAYCVSASDSVYVVDCSADTVEKVVPLPHDYYPMLITCSPKSGRLYCLPQEEGNEFREIMVVDCIGDSFLRFLPTGLTPLTMGLDPKHDRLYTANHLTDDATVIDCAGDSVVETIGLGFMPEVLAYASNENKVYCGGRSFERIIAIDAATNRVVAEIPTGTLVSDMCYNPVLSKLYSVYGGYDTVVAIDCRKDSIVARIGVGDGPCYLAFSPVGRSKVYCSNTNESTVSVIDCVRDSVVAEIEVGGDASDLLVNTQEDKVYCHVLGENTVVIDCHGDSILRRSDVRGNGLVYNPEENKAYVGYHYLYVLDGRTDSAVAVLDTVNEIYWVSGCYNTRNHKTYALVRSRPGALLVLDGVTDTLLAVIWEPAGGWGMNSLLYNSMNSKVYIASNDDWFVAVFDGAADSLVAKVTVGSYPRDLVWSPVHNRTYAACYLGSCVSVIRDSLVPGVEEGYVPQAEGHELEPTIVTRTLRLEYGIQRTGHRAELLDAVGCVVMELVPGENDVRDLSPGVYFVRETSAQAIRKVLVTR